MKDLTKEMNFAENQKTTLSELKALADRLLATTWTIQVYRSRLPQEINLKELGWTFEFNSRKRAAGICNYTKKIICLSKYLVNQNLEKSLEFENTLRHELAHALDGAMGQRNHHNRVWQLIAKQVLCTAERCYSSNDIADKKSKYTFVCDTCKKESASHKKVKKRKACGVCCNTNNGGRFSDKYVLRQVQNY
jgi:predicted SprT family Zn-dependent metalloprotease